MNDAVGIDRDFIEYVVKQIVDEPDAVEVTRSVDELGVLITLKVGKFDMGKIIGKNGQTAKALRVLLRVIGSKNNARVNLKIIEPDGSEMAMDASNDDAAPATEEAPAVEEAPVLEEEVADQHADLPDDLGADVTPGMDAPEATADETAEAPAEEVAEEVVAEETEEAPSEEAPAEEAPAEEEEPKEDEAAA